ncbi:helix-turn-helix domain-containing protein, partial [Candidatus Pacearchaeota archaeon]|nr:helix-turn-helix domain-containing protein [Candidatus Pacearchaeota archaeon]
QIAKKLIETILKSKKAIKGKFGFVDVGEGSEIFVNVPRTKFENAVTLLQNEGYSTHYLKQEQLGTGKKTSLKILGTPGATYNDAVANKANISIPDFFTEDSGLTFHQPEAINNFSSDRILVKYRDNGGGAKDGLIEMRRGVPELNLGNKPYAQVRIGVDGTHFMKGMAVLKEDIPTGYDIVYNTSKLSTGNKLDAMKSQIEEGASRFKAVVRPNTFEQDGKTVFGVVNIVGSETPKVEGHWAGWKKNLSSQILSKQSPRLSTKQLDITYKNSLAELSDIMDLTNPTVRNHLLIDFADKADKASTDLKAAALPRQTNNVLLPDPNMKPNEIYAPYYNNGETVVLIRHPHGGIFEIPTLVVNNKYSEYRKIIGTTPEDAVAVHPDVAHKLSGADFDGDTVLIVPNKTKQIRTEPTLETLKNFNAKEKYPYYPGMKVMTELQKERKMGDISNLITDMTIKGAPQKEIARAVKHSMVVIDAANHELNYTQSRLDNGIAALKTKYQGSGRAGAATLISKAKSEERVPQRRDHYTINPKTGEKVFSYTYETYIHPKTGKEISLTTKSTKMGESKDGYQFVNRKGKLVDLSSGTVIESVYADHANNMKSLGNQARLATLKKEPTPYSKKARVAYKPEVISLDTQYKAAVRHRPIERKAQILGGEIYKAQVVANPGMSGVEKKTAKGRALVLARIRLGATKPVIKITPREWEAVEMGAVSQTRLKGILRNADMDAVRTYATPRAVRGGLSTAKTTRARSLIKAGYTAAEIASAIGVPVSQIRTIDKE